MAKKKRSAAQKKAYYSGMGYRAGEQGVVILFKNPENRESFRNGYRKAKNAVSRYPKRAK